MYKELRKEAKKKVEAKMAFYICAIAFSSVSIVLLMLSFYMPSIGIWKIADPDFHDGFGHIVSIYFWIS